MCNENGAAPKVELAVELMVVEDIGPLLPINVEFQYNGDGPNDPGPPAVGVGEKPSCCCCCCCCCC